MVAATYAVKANVNGCQSLGEFLLVAPGLIVAVGGTAARPSTEVPHRAAAGIAQNTPGERIHGFHTAYNDGA